MGDNTELNQGQVAEFAYTDMNKAPEQHRTVAIQFAMGMPTNDIHISTGYPRAYVEKILSHPPAIAYAGAMKRALDNQVVQNIGQWSSLLPDAIAKVKESIGSRNERVALTASLEYLDRHPSAMFVKRKFVEGAPDKKILGSTVIDELKRNAAQLEGQDNGRSDESAREAGVLEDESAGDADDDTSIYPEPPEPRDQRAAMDGEHVAGPVEGTSDPGGPEEANGGPAAYPEPAD